MIQLYIQEKREVTPEGTFIFDYVGDVVNLFLNKPKVYRVCYFPREDIYLVGDAYSYIHGDLIRQANSFGYELKGAEGRDMVFCPYKEIEKESDPDGWGVGWFNNERPYRLPITSGYLLAENKPYLQKYFPDLVKKLKPYFIEDPNTNPDALYPEYNYSNLELLALMDLQCSIYIRDKGWNEYMEDVYPLLGGSVTNHLNMMYKLYNVIAKSGGSENMLKMGLSKSSFDEYKKEMLKIEKNLKNSFVTR